MRSLAPLHCFAFRTYTVGNIQIPKIPFFPTHVCTVYLQDFSHTEGVISNINEDILVLTTQPCCMTRWLMFLRLKAGGGAPWGRGTTAAAMVHRVLLSVLID